MNKTVKELTINLVALNIVLLSTLGLFWKILNRRRSPIRSRKGTQNSEAKQAT